MKFLEDDGDDFEYSFPIDNVEIISLVGEISNCKLIWAKREKCLARW